MGERSSQLATKAQKSYEAMRPLIVYYENEEKLNTAFSKPLQKDKETRQLTADYLRLVATNKELKQLIEQAENIKENGLIDSLDNINSKRDYFQNILD